MKFAVVVALLAVAAAVGAVTATSAAEQQHDEAAIAAVAATMPEHAAAFAELSAAAGTADVFAVLDAISANVEAERKHAQVFYRSYKKTTARDIRKYKLLIARLGGSERRARVQTVAERREAKQLRRQVNANVRTLSRAVARFQHVQGEERRTTHKKKTAMRHLNNKIADRKTYLKVLRAIRKALSDSSKPTGARFVEALAVAHQNGMGASAAAPAVFLQLSEEQADAAAVEQTTDNADELEADAAIDHEAFEMADMPAANELELVADAEDEADDAAEDADELEAVEAADADDEAADEAEEDAEDAAEDAAEDQDEAEDAAEAEDVSEEEADEALDAADAAEEEAEDEAENEDESEADSEAEAGADAEDELDSASEARMMQVLSALSSGARDDASTQELVQLIDTLVADVRESVASAKKRKVAVLAKYTQQMKNLQELANAIKQTIRRLQTTVQQGRARLAALEQTTNSVDASSKENDAQLKAYRSMHRGIKANWAKYERRYRKNQAKRDRQLEQLAELKRRLAAVERSKGSLGVDLSKVSLRYRWKAYPFGACQAACGPSIRVRKVKCLSFSGKPVKHTFCDGLKKPKRQVKCQKKLCPANCVVSAWKARGKCSNACGTGVRLHTRKVVEPARFGGSCPQQFRLTKHKACRSLRACKDGAAPTRQSRAEGKAAIAARRERRQARRVQNALRRDADRAAALQRRNAAAASGAFVPNRRVLTPQQLKKRAKNARCRACRPGKAGGACRFKNCLNKAQKLACKSCPKGKAGRRCRERKCKGPAQARRKALKKAAKARRAAKRAAARAAGAKAPISEKKRAKNRRCLACRKGKEGRKCRLNNCMTKAQKAACKSCGKGKGKRARRCREEKCKNVVRARRAVLKERKAARKAAKRAGLAFGAGAKAPISEKKRAKNRRCLACRKGKEGRKCRLNNCLSKAQKAECKACGKGQSVAARECRQDKCRGPIRARRAVLKARKAARKAAKRAAAAGLTVGPKAPLSEKKRAKNRRCLACRKGKEGRKCRLNNCMSKAQKAACKACGKGKGKRARRCREEKCKNVVRARRALLKERRAARRAAKRAAARDPIAAGREPVTGRVPRAFHYKPSGVVTNADGAVTAWNDATKRGRHLTSVGGSDPEVAPRRAAGKRAVRFDHTGLQSGRLRLGDRFDVFAVLRFDGNPHKPNNRWGAASAFMVNAPRKTPANPFAHGTSGGVGVAVTDGQFRLIAEGKAWGEGGADVARGTKYIVRLRRRGPHFQLFVGADQRKPVATLTSDIVEDATARLKLGVSDALYFGWEGAIFEVVGFDALLTREQVRETYDRLRTKFL